MTFNWHELEEGFLKWMIVNLVASSNEKSKVDELSEATKGLTEVNLKIQINGIDIPTDYFVSRIEANMTYQANKEAARLVENLESLRNFQRALNRIERDFESARETMRQHINQAFQAEGISLPDYDDLTD